mmetsp:Transcript_3863/g.5739  ORF Transcript_3863/g.5739 Transcript_3863/m.5739 type:complete len:459 (-) Transcript_3863:334-1710(-)
MNSYGPHYVTLIFIFATILSIQISPIKGTSSGISNTNLLLDSSQQEAPPESLASIRGGSQSIPTSNATDHGNVNLVPSHRPTSTRGGAGGTAVGVTTSTSTSSQVQDLPSHRLSRPAFTGNKPLVPLPSFVAAQDHMGAFINAKELIKRGVSGVVGFGQVFAKTIVEAKQHLIAAGVARGVSVLTMYPLDTIKTRLQMDPAMLAKVGGLFNGNLYAGVVGSMIGQVPYGTLTFGSYEVYKELLSKSLTGINQTFIYLIAACMGDITGSFWLVPSEVVKQKMQTGAMSQGLGGTVSAVWREKGLGGFYAGYSSQISRDVPFRAIQLVSYETVKSAYLRWRSNRRAAAGLKEQEELSGVEGVILGAIAGSFSAACTTPLDVIKTRMMTEATGQSVVEVASSLLQSGGVQGLFRGLGARVGYIAPSAAIFFCTYELVRQRIRALDAAKATEEAAAKLEKSS